jgi:hypothetical protein
MVSSLSHSNSVEVAPAQHYGAWFDVNLLQEGYRGHACIRNQPVLQCDVVQE